MIADSGAEHHPRRAGAADDGATATTSERTSSPSRTPVSMAVLRVRSSSKTSPPSSARSVDSRCVWARSNASQPARNCGVTSSRWTTVRPARRVRGSGEAAGPLAIPNESEVRRQEPFDRLRTGRRSRTLRRVTPLPGSVPCQDSSPSIVGYYADGGQVFEFTTSLIVCGLASTRPSVWPMSLRTRIDCTLYQMPRGIVVRAVPASRESPRRGWVSVRGRRSWMATPAFRCDCRAGAA